MNGQDAPVGQLERIWNADNEREVRVITLLKSNAVKDKEELYYAAFILQHSNCNKFIYLAHQLSEASMRKGNDKAKWLYAATLDRFLIGEGKIQKYGTQFSVKDGVKVFLPVDPNTTDSDRAKYNVPPLKKSSD